MVEKQWRVAEADEEGHLTLVTRRGKVHVTDARDRNLRHANLWERWRLRDRFPAPILENPTRPHPHTDDP